MATKGILGVDVGTGSVKVLAGTADGAGNIVVKGSGAGPSAGFRKGLVTDATALAAAIKEAVDCATMVAGMPHFDVYLGIGGSDITSINSIGSVAPASSRGITGEDLERACTAAGVIAVPDDRRVLHVLPVNYWVDGELQTDVPLDLPGTRLEVECHIVTMSQSLFDELTDALHAIGVHTAGVVANAIVGTLAVVPDTGFNECLMIDIGAGTTDLVLYNRGAITASASLPLGGDYITGDIAQGLGVSSIHAEEIKRYYGKLDKALLGQGTVLDCNDYGTTDLHVAYDFLYNIVESRVEEIVSMVHGYFDSVLAGNQVNQILLTGGSALLPSVRHEVEKTFVIPVYPAQLEGFMPLEYAHQSNTASYGILSYAAKVNKNVVKEAGAWRSLWKKLHDWI